MLTGKTIFRHKHFVHRVSGMLSWVTDTLMPQDLDLHTKSVDAAIELILKRVPKSRIAGEAGEQ